MFGNLPTELTELILMKLSMKDAFRTSTVSKNWMHAWNTTPKLVLDDEKFMHADNYESMFVEFVDRLLWSREGPILQFHLSTSIKNKKKINRWLLFALRYNKIKMIHLDVRCAKKYRVPSLFFSSCHELVHLKLFNCELTLPQDFKGFNMLKNLHLENVKITDSELKNLLSSCTQLEELAFIDLPRITEIDIRNTKVRQLNIVGYCKCFELENQSLISATLINKLFYGDVHGLHTIFFCKNLVHLEISGYNNLVLPSLGDMKLETIKLSLLTLPPDSITNLVSKCPRLKKLDAMIGTGYEEIQIVSTSLQSLKIGCCYSHLHLACPQLIDASIYIDNQNFASQALYGLYKEKRLSLKELEHLQTKVKLPAAFNHLEKLSLNVRFRNLMCEYTAFSFIEKARGLHALEIMSGPPDFHPDLQLGSIWQYLMKLDLEIRFKNLTTLTILECYGLKEEFLFLEFILNAAPMLQEIKIRFIRHSNVPSHEHISRQEILALTKSYMQKEERDRKLKVIFCTDYSQKGFSESYLMSTTSNTLVCEYIIY